MTYDDLSGVYSISDNGQVSAGPQWNQMAANAWAERQEKLRDDYRDVMTPDKPTNAILHDIENPVDIARRAAASYQSKMAGGLASFGRMGDTLHIGGNTVTETLGADAARAGLDVDSYINRLRKAEGARQAAALGSMSRYAGFQNELPDRLMGPQRRALYQLATGIDPYDEQDIELKKQKAVADAARARIVTMEGAFGFNPMEAFLHYDPTSKMAKIPGRPVKNELGEYVQGPSRDIPIPDWLYAQIKEIAPQFGYHDQQTVIPSLDDRAAKEQRLAELRAKAAGAKPVYQPPTREQQIAGMRGVVPDALLQQPAPLSIEEKIMSLYPQWQYQLMGEARRINPFAGSTIR